MYMVAKCFNNKELSEQRDQFSSLDKDFDGYISIEELKKSLQGVRDNH